MPNDGAARGVSRMTVKDARRVACSCRNRTMFALAKDMDHGRTIGCAGTFNHRCSRTCQFAVEPYLARAWSCGHATGFGERPGGVIESPEIELNVPMVVLVTLPPVDKSTMQDG